MLPRDVQAKTSTKRRRHPAVLAVPGCLPPVPCEVHGEDVVSGTITSVTINGVTKTATIDHVVWHSADLPLIVSLDCA